MDITVSHDHSGKPVTILRSVGDIDASSSAELEREAAAAIEGGARNLVVDLSGVSYMGSAGVRALHKIFTQLRAANEDVSDEVMLRGLRDGTFKSPNLKLLAPSKKVHEVLNLTGMNMYLEIFPTLDKALASF